MADIEKTIQIIFGATDDGLGTQISTIGSSLKTAEQNIGSITGPLASVTKGLLASEAAVIGLAAAYGGFAINQAIKFQTAQIDLAKVLQATDPDIESFTAGVLELSDTYGIASSSIIQGIANFKQAGFTAQESALLQKNALDLVIAGDVEASRATEILIASLKGFGAEANQSSRFIEALNNVSNEYATDLGQLATGMAQISPVASKMGFTFEETTGLITPVIEVFRSGSEASRALRTGLLKLIDDAKPVGQALSEIGVSQLDVNGQMRSGKDIFLDVAGAFQTLDEKQKLVITSQLVGIDQAAKMVTVFDNLALVQGVTATAMERTGSVTQEVALRLASAGKQIDILGQNFNNLGKEVGDKLLPSFTGVTGGVNELLSSLRAVVANGSLDGLFDALAAEGVDFTNILSGIAKALPEAFEGLDISGLLDSFGNLKGAVSSLFDGLDLTDPDDLNVLLQNLVNFLGLMTNASAGAVKGIKPLIDGVISFLGVLANSDSGLQDFIGQIGGMATAIDTILPLLGFLGDAIILVGGSLTILSAAKGVSTLAGIGTQLKGIAPVGIAAVVALGAVTFAIEENSKAYDEYKAREKDIADTIEHTNETRGKIVDRLAEISKETGVAITSMDEFNTALDNGVIALDDSEVGYKKAESAIGDYGTQVSDLVDSQESGAISADDFAAAVSGVGDEVVKSASGLNRTEQATKDLATAMAEADANGESYRVTTKNGVDVLEKFGGASKKAAAAQAKLDEATGKLTERQRIAVEQTNKVELALLNLASNERIAALEFTAKINVAQIEGDAKQVEAIMGSVNAAFENTGDVLSALTAGFDSAFTDSDRQFFKDKIDEELKIDKDALAITKKTSDARIALIEAQTRQLNQGGPTFSIDAPDLAPELQIVLKSIIDTITIQAVNDGLEILV